MRKDEPRVNLLIISQDVIDRHLAGPGLRYSQMAASLSTDLVVTLAAPQGKDPEIALVHFLIYGKDSHALRQSAMHADVILLSGAMLAQFPFLLRTHARLVIDLYDPILFENLHYFKDEPLSVQKAKNAADIEMMNALTTAGDFFICGSERQRDFWLGVLAANGRVNPSTLEADPELHQLIDVVGMGIPAGYPQGNPYLKGIHPQVPLGAKIVLWGGGIWNWLDPLTLIKAWPEVVARVPEARLVFLGTRHPNPDVPRHEMAQKAQVLAEEIAEMDQSILFFKWLTSHEREALLSESDVGVICQPASAETHFALRTRMLDYFWARLPIVSMDGDVLSETVQQYHVGWVVEPGEVKALSKALVSALRADRKAINDHYQLLVDTYLWENQVSPLRSYCLNGDLAPDRQDRRIPLPFRLGSRIKRKLGRVFKRSSFRMDG